GGVIQRAGQLTSAGAGLVLTETIDSPQQTAVRQMQTTTWSCPDPTAPTGIGSCSMSQPGATPNDFVEHDTITWQLDPNDIGKYQNRPLSSDVYVDEQPGQVVLHGLQEVGNLGYHTVV